MGRPKAKAVPSRDRLTKQEVRTLSLLLYYCNNHIGDIYETFEDNIREEDVNTIAKKLGATIPK